MPKDITMLEFPSNHLVDNIRHVPRVLPENPSMLNFFRQGNYARNSDINFNDRTSNLLVDSKILCLKKIPLEYLRASLEA